MSSHVTITIHGDILDGKDLVFKGRTFCTVGRSSNCYLQLPSSSAFLDISRHHCLLEVDPPRIRVRDLGSLNGTFINDHKIGQPARDQSGESPADIEATAVPLKDGDRVRIGKIVLGVKIFAPEEAIPSEILEEKEHCRRTLERSTSPQ